MGIGQRIGAGIGAAGAFVGGTVSPLANVGNNNNQPIQNNDIPAIVQKALENAGPRSLADIANQYSGDGYRVNMPEEFQESQPSTLETPIEQNESEPSTAQKAGELGDGVNDLAGIVADAKKGKDEADKSMEVDSVLSNHYKNASGKGDGPDQNTSPSNDNNYYNGMSY